MKKGFTLIELLVVVAIIAVLASVVLISLNTARNKGKDSAIKEQMFSMHAEAALYYDNNNNSYRSVAGSDVLVLGLSACDSWGTNTLFENGVQNSLYSLMEGIDKLTSGDVVCGINGSGTSWAVSYPLATSGTWCVDNTGFSAESVGINGLSLNCIE